MGDDQPDAGPSPEAVQLVEGTYLSDRFASGLRGLGIERGARVALMLAQTPEHVVAHIAVFKLGAIAVPLSRLFGSDVLSYRLRDSGTVAIVTDGENARFSRSATGCRRSLT